MLKCASPAVLINLQCPTTQVRDCPVEHCAKQSIFLNLSFKTGEVYPQEMCFLPQLCVSKCPDRFATLSEVSVNKSWEYYRQFCKPGFVLGSKVGNSDRCLLYSSHKLIYS